MRADWRARHPFRLGQIVYAMHDLRFGPLAFGAGRALRVHLRGWHEQADRFWFAIEGAPGHCLPVESFTAVRPMPPGVDGSAAPDHGLQSGGSGAGAPWISDGKTIPAVMPAIGGLA